MKQSEFFLVRLGSVRARRKNHLDATYRRIAWMESFTEIDRSTSTRLSATALLRRCSDIAPTVV